MDSRPLPYQGSALPLSYRGVADSGFEPLKLIAADLQSAPFDRLGNPPLPMLMAWATLLVCHFLCNYASPTCRIQENFSIYRTKPSALSPAQTSITASLASGTPMETLIPSPSNARTARLCARNLAAASAVLLPSGSQK